MKNRKLLSVLLAIATTLSLTACGGQSAPAPSADTATEETTDTAEEAAEPAEETAEAEATEEPAAEETAADAAAEWTRQGMFTDENNNMLSIYWNADADEPGWYVSAILGEDYEEDGWGGMIAYENGTLKGALPSFGSKDDITATITEEGDDGVKLAIDGGESYVFAPMELPDATIFVNINIEGIGGMIGYELGETVPVLDPETPFQSAVLNLAEPETYTFAAQALPGNLFVKWTKNGEDYSTDPVFTVLLDESADYVAVFEEDPDWQNPVMNHVGRYSHDKAIAVVECFGYEDAWITIDWDADGEEISRWDITGRLDTENNTITYDGILKSILVHGEEELETKEQEYIEGSGTITFNDDNSFTWHDDNGEIEGDLNFEWAPAEPDAR